MKAGIPQAVDEAFEKSDDISSEDLDDANSLNDIPVSDHEPEFEDNEVDLLADEGEVSVIELD